MQTRVIDIRGGGQAAVPANPRKRIVSLTAAGLLHAIILYGLFQAFVAPHMVKPPEGTTLVPTIPDTPPEQPVVDKPPMVDPQVVTAVPPDFRTQQDSDRTITTVQTDKPPVKLAALPPEAQFSAAVSIASTHTIPAYPDMAIRLGQEGTVTLRLNVAADGSVTGASVEQSSGSDALDTAAVAWVKGKWRYKPATRNGEAVESTVLAAVRFDLKKVR